MICAVARPGFFPPQPTDNTLDNNNEHNIHVNAAPTFEHDVGCSAVLTTAGFDGDVLLCAPCDTHDGNTHSNTATQTQYLLGCAVLPPGSDPLLAMAKQHEVAQRDTHPFHVGNQHALDIRVSNNRWRIVYSPKSVAVCDDLLYALNELSSDAMNGDANVYPTASLTSLTGAATATT